MIHWRLVLALGFLEILAENPAKATPAPDPAVGRRSEGPKSPLRLAWEHLRRCERDQAVELSRRSLAEEPSAEAIYLILSIRWQQGRAGDARAAFTEYLGRLRDPQRLSEALRAEPELFSDAALGAYGSRAELHDGECERSDSGRGERQEGA